jgi:hypothetical protein
MTELERGVIRAGEKVPPADGGCADPRADGEIHEVIEPDACAERTLAKDRNLRVVLEEGGKSQSSSDRTREIGTRKAWAKVRGLYRNPRPRIQRARRADPHPHQPRHGTRIFTFSALSCELQRADACGHDGLRSLRYGRWCCSTSEARAVCANKRGAHLCPSEV